MSDNKYLDILANIFGVGKENDTDKTMHDVRMAAFDRYADTYDELKADLVKWGIEAGEYGEPGDGIWCIWDDGVLKLTGYISTRGSAFQAGAFDGKIPYGCSNIRDGMEYWTEVEPSWTCAKIAIEGWHHE